MESDATKPSENKKPEPNLPPVRVSAQTSRHARVTHHIHYTSIAHKSFFERHFFTVRGEETVPRRKKGRGTRHGRMTLQGGKRSLQPLRR